MSANKLCFVSELSAVSLAAAASQLHAQHNQTCVLITSALIRTCALALAGARIKRCVN